MRILVTGANGYIGRGVVTCLLDEGHEVIATDFSFDNIDDRAEKKVANIFDLKEPFDVFGKPDCLLHLAWKDGFSHYSDAHIEELPNHYKFIKNMIEGGLKKLAVMGSMHEVGFFEGSIDENTRCLPTTPYGIGKNALRSLAQLLCSSNNVTFQWLRGYYIVGFTERGNSIFSKIVSKANIGEKYFPFTMGQNQYDFLDYDDFCQMVAKTVAQNDVTGIINICSGHPEKLADRVERFISENELDIKLEYGAFPDRPYDSKAVWGNNEKIELIMSTKR